MNRSSPFLWWPLGLGSSSGGISDRSHSAWNSSSDWGLTIPIPSGLGPHLDDTFLACFEPPPLTCSGSGEPAAVRVIIGANRQSADAGQNGKVGEVSSVYYCPDWGKQLRDTETGLDALRDCQPESDLVIGP